MKYSPAPSLVFFTNEHNNTLEMLVKNTNTGGGIQKVSRRYPEGIQKVLTTSSEQLEKLFTRSSQALHKL